MEWNDLSKRMGRNDLPGILARAVLIDETLTDEAEIRKGLQSAWCSAEWPLRTLSRDIWLSLFGRVIKVREYLEELEVEPISSLPDDLTLYRAATEGYENGLSWTEDKDRAIWFADRFQGALGEHKLYRIDNARLAVIAHYNERRGEDEYVLDLDVFEPQYQIVEIPKSGR